MASSSGGNETQAEPGLSRRRTVTGLREPAPLIRHDTISARPKENPWTPLVLSLDGGGVRGLSTLFIIRRIMERIKEMLAEKPEEDPILGALTEQSLSFSSSTGRTLEPTAEGSETVDTTNAEATATVAPSPTDAQVPVSVPNDATNGHSTPQAPDTSDWANAHINGGTDLPLPCYFFDFIIGTSTGGLIAVMLGLLRMNIDDCIAEYWKLSNAVFRPHNLVLPYSAHKLNKAIRSVVSRHCHCHRTGECRGSEPLRQYDYYEAELDHDNPNDGRVNRTCKVGLVSVRKGSKSDRTYLWRTYDHTRRLTNPIEPLELNPHEISGGQVDIRGACRATTAAPFYFSLPKIGVHNHMDGGVGNNNPSGIALDEASFMSMSKGPSRFGVDDNGANKVAVMLSVGTGQHGEETRFGTWNLVLKLLRHMRGSITDTEKAHDATRGAARKGDCNYYRFTVPREGCVGNNHGLSKMKLSACKKSPKARQWWQKIANSSVPDETPARPQWYQDLQKKAGQDFKGGYKPTKYDYSTFEELFQRTMEYYTCGRYYAGPQDNGMLTDAAIDRCATQLIEYAKRRREDNRERWKCFVSHPHPEHPMFLQSPLKTDGHGQLLGNYRS